MNYETLMLFKLYLITMPVLFVIGIYSIIITRNIISIIIGLEIMTKGVTILLAAAGFFNDKADLVEPLIITMIVVEVVILIISSGYIVNIAKKYDSLDTENLKNIKE